MLALLKRDPRNRYETHVGMTRPAPESGIDKLFGLLALEYVFLSVGDGFDEEASGPEGNADITCCGDRSCGKGIDQVDLENQDKSASSSFHTEKQLKFPIELTGAPTAPTQTACIAHGMANLPAEDFKLSNLSSLPSLWILSNK